MAVQARSALVTLAMAHLGMPNPIDANWKANPVNDVHGDSHGQKRISDPCKAAGDDWDVHLASSGADGSGCQWVTFDM